MSEEYITRFSLLRCQNVKTLNRLLTENDRIICTDSALGFKVEIKFIKEEKKGTPIEELKDKAKIEMIRKILDLKL